MSDYSFMKSGFNTLENNNKYDPNDVVATILHFIEHATRSASIYVKHSDRNSVTPEDIKRGMMLEIFLFSKSSSTKSLIKREQFTWPKITGNDLTQIDFFPNCSKITPKFSNSSINSSNIEERSSPISTISGINNA